MGFLSQIANVFTGSEDAKAARRAGEVQQQQAQSSAVDIRASGDAALARFDPLAAVGQRGVDLSGFLGDPQAQYESIQANPLFKMGLENLNDQTLNMASTRGRLSAGDTLNQLTQNATLAATPLIDRQRQDILNLLGIGQNAAGAQGQIDQNTAANIANLLGGGAAAQAGGIVGAQNARSSGMGNVLDIAGLAIGAPTGTFSQFLPSSNAPPTQYTGGKFSNFPPI